MDHLLTLKNLVLAPYILKSTALIGVCRKVGGNQFRHSFATLGILLDYKYFDDPVLLKGSLIHDFFEDLTDRNLDEIRNIDEDGSAVVDLVLEVTRNEVTETKLEYMQRLYNCSTRAKILKCADRISNLTDLHLDTHTNQKISDYLDQTEIYVLPLAREVNRNFEKELIDLIAKRRELCHHRETPTMKTLMKKDKLFNMLRGFGFVETVTDSYVIFMLEDEIFSFPNSVSLQDYHYASTRFHLDMNGWICRDEFDKIFNNDKNWK